MFCLYTSHLGTIINKYGFNFHVYADDVQIYVGFKRSDYLYTLSRLERCVDELRSWMTFCKLKINDDKTEFVIFSTNHLKHVFRDIIFKIGEEQHVFWYYTPNRSEEGFLL